MESRIFCRILQSVRGRLRIREESGFVSFRRLWDTEMEMPKRIRMFESEDEGN